MHGSDKLSYSEIKAWAQLTGNEPTPLEVKAIRQIDHLFWSSLNE